MVLKVVRSEPSVPTALTARVEIEYNDGSVRVWAGEDALAFIAAVTTLPYYPVPEPTKTLKVPRAGSATQEA